VCEQPLPTRLEHTPWFCCFGFACLSLSRFVSSCCVPCWTCCPTPPIERVPHLFLHPAPIFPPPCVLLPQQCAVVSSAAWMAVGSDCIGCHLCQPTINAWSEPGAFLLSWLAFESEPCRSVLFKRRSRVNFPRSRTQKIVRPNRHWCQKRTSGGLLSSVLSLKVCIVAHASVVVNPAPTCHPRPIVSWCKWVPPYTHNNLAMAPHHGTFQAAASCT